jgi:hypothetical protein
MNELPSSQYDPRFRAPSTLSLLQAAPWTTRGASCCAPHTGMHICCGSTACCYRPTSPPRHLGPAQLNLYEPTSNNRNAAYSQHIREGAVSKAPQGNLLRAQPRMERWGRRFAPMRFSDQQSYPRSFVHVALEIDTFFFGCITSL